MPFHGLLALQIGAATIALGAAITKSDGFDTYRYEPATIMTRIK